MPSIDQRAADKLDVRDLLAAYALLRGQKVAHPELALLREAFPAVFRPRPRWSPAAWDECDRACAAAIRARLRDHGRLHLVSEPSAH